MTNPYPPETLDSESDDGTMPASLDALREAVIGHRIVKVERKSVPDRWGGNFVSAMVLTLDTGQEVRLVGEHDCCAFTEVEAFLLHPELVNHVILGVGTTDGYTTWHIYADLGDVLELTVGWSCGNPFYYGYGFTITVDGNVSQEFVAKDLLEVERLTR
jgi:hypothetical protein